MKKIILSIILVLLLITTVFASDLSVGKSLANFPKDSNWLVEKEDPEGYLSYLANWRITNTTDRNINLNEMTLKLFGTGDDTKFLTMIYPDLDEDGKIEPYMYGYAIATSDNETIVISFDENVLIPANSHKYLMIVYSKIQGKTFNDGDTFQNYLTKLKGNFEDDGTETISVSPGTGYLSSKTTAINMPTYFIEVTSSEEYMMLSGGEEYTQGGMIENGVLQEEDIAFKIYENCNLTINNEFVFTSGATKLSNATPLGQSFKMYHPENITSIALNMRSTYVTEDDTVKVRIRKDSIGGEIIKETTLFVEGIQYNSWFLFNFENTCEASCGNNLLDEGEVCDGDYLDGKVCKDIEGYYYGYLNCNNCEISTDQCLNFEEYLEFNCPNYFYQGKEFDCNNLNGFKDINFVEGKYSYNQDCEVDLSECSTTKSESKEEEPEQIIICGDNKKEGTEYCDGTDLGGKTCEDYGFNAGELQCTQTCTISTSACYNKTNPTPSENEPLPKISDDSNEPINQEEPIDENQETLTGNQVDENRFLKINQTTQNQETEEFPIIIPIIIGIILLASIVFIARTILIQKSKEKTNPKKKK